MVIVAVVCGMLAFMVANGFWVFRSKDALSGSLLVCSIGSGVFLLGFLSMPLIYNFEGRWKYLVLQLIATMIGVAASVWCNKKNASDPSA